MTTAAHDNDTKLALQVYVTTLEEFFTWDFADHRFFAVLLAELCFPKRRGSHRPPGFYTEASFLVA